MGEKIKTFVITFIPAFFVLLFNLGINQDKELSKVILYVQISCSLTQFKESIQRSHIQDVLWCWLTIKQSLVILHLLVLSIVDSVYSWKLCQNGLPPCDSSIPSLTQSNDERLKGCVGLEITLRFCLPFLDRFTSDVYHLPATHSGV